MPTDPHGPNNFGRYVETHDTVLSQFQARDFVSRHTLNFSQYGNSIQLSGEIACLGNIVIQVQKILDVVEPPQVVRYNVAPLLQKPAREWTVQTSEYSYNVSLQGHSNLFRYDNTDDFWVKDSNHPDKHHKHLYDWQTGRQLPDSPVWVGREGWPTLGAVIDEASDWYYEHWGQIPERDSYPTLGLGHSPTTSRKDPPSAEGDLNL